MEQGRMREKGGEREGRKGEGRGYEEEEEEQRRSKEEEDEMQRSGEGDHPPPPSSPPPPHHPSPVSLFPLPPPYITPSP